MNTRDTAGHADAVPIGGAIFLTKKPGHKDDASFKHHKGGSNKDCLGPRRWMTEGVDTNEEIFECITCLARTYTTLTILPVASTKKILELHFIY